MRLFQLVFLFILMSLSSCKTDTQENAISEPQAQGKSIVEDHERQSPYHGKEKEILNFLVVNEIPMDFPRAKERESMKEYRKRCREWAKNNRAMIKTEYREKLDNFEKQEKE